MRLSAMPFTSDRHLQRRLGLAVLAILAAPLPVLAEELDPWQAASTFLVKDAHDLFRRGAGGSELERDFGIAITLLNLQPRTQGNLKRALELLESVAARSEAGGNLQNLALFFRARVLEYYIQPADPAAAAAQYLELLERRTKNPVIELGASRLVIMAGLGPAPRESNLEELRRLERLAELLDTPAGKREFHATMAYAILDNNGAPSLAVDHFLKAEKVGFSRKISALRLWMVGGDVAVRAADADDAAVVSRDPPAGRRCPRPRSLLRSDRRRRPGARFR